MNEKTKTLKLTEMELIVLEALLRLAIKNGNSANSQPYEPTPEQYKLVSSIHNKVRDKW